MPKHAAMVQCMWEQQKVRLTAGIGLGFICTGRGYLHSHSWEEWRRGQACKIKSIEIMFEVLGMGNMVEVRIIWPPVKQKVENQLHTVRDLSE